AENGRQFYVPAGFAHGFCVTGESALFAYKCTDFYNAAADGAIRWDDPEIGIDWPLDDPAISPKDSAAPLLSDLAPARLPEFSE
ncbi:MAG: dTDP-4-dehydrorhamnose 3,5-epimerase, partial [Alphaproteobacteria bacterium]